MKTGNQKSIKICDFGVLLDDPILGKTFVAATGEAFNFLCRADIDVQNAGCCYGSREKIS